MTTIDESPQPYCEACTKFDGGACPILSLLLAQASAGALVVDCPQLDPIPAPAPKAKAANVTTADPPPTQE